MNKRSYRHTSCGLYSLLIWNTHLKSTNSNDSANLQPTWISTSKSNGYTTTTSKIYLSIKEQCPNIQRQFFNILFHLNLNGSNSIPLIILKFDSLMHTDVVHIFHTWHLVQLKGSIQLIKSSLHFIRLPSVKFFNEIIILYKTKLVSDHIFWKFLSNWLLSALWPFTHC